MATNEYEISALSVDIEADPRYADLTMTENKTGHRIIGGDKGDLLFGGYSTANGRTNLYRPVLRTKLELSATEAEEVARGVLDEAFAGLGEECLW